MKFLTNSNNEKLTVETILDSKKARDAFFETIKNTENLKNSKILPPTPPPSNSNSSNHLEDKLNPTSLSGESNNINKDLLTKKTNQSTSINKNQNQSTSLNGSIIAKNLSNEMMR